jgi:hypothetical protein
MRAIEVELCSGMSSRLVADAARDGLCGLDMCPYAGPHASRPSQVVLRCPACRAANCGETLWQSETQLQ